MYNGLTKTEARECYGFTEPELKQIKFSVGFNGWGGKVFIYQKSDLELFAIKKYGSVAAAVAAANLRRTTGSAKGRADAFETRLQVASNDIGAIGVTVGQVHAVAQEAATAKYANNDQVAASFMARADAIATDLETMINKRAADLVSGAAVLLADAHDLQRELALAARKAPDCGHYAWRHVLRHQGLCYKCGETERVAAAADKAKKLEALKVAAWETSTTLNLPPLRGSSPQVEWARQIRHEFFSAMCSAIGQAQAVDLLRLPAALDARTWIDNRKKVPASMAALLRR